MRTFSSHLTPSDEELDMVDSTTKRKWQRERRKKVEIRLADVRTKRKEEKENRASKRWSVPSYDRCEEPLDRGNGRSLSQPLTDTLTPWAVSSLTVESADASKAYVDCQVMRFPQYDTHMILVDQRRTYYCMQNVVDDSVRLSCPTTMHITGNLCQNNTFIHPGHRTAGSASRRHIALTLIIRIPMCDADVFGCRTIAIIVRARRAERIIVTTMAAVQLCEALESHLKVRFGGGVLSRWEWQHGV
jgi:hypothetical protein